MSVNLNQQDREWIGAIIEKAASETLNKSRDFTRQMVGDHGRCCPNVTRLKWMLGGLGIGLGISLPQIADAVLKFIR